MPAFRVVLRGTMLGQTVNNQRFWVTIPSNPDIPAFVNALGAAFKTAIQPITPSVLTWTDTYVIPAVTGSLGAAYVPTGFPFSGSDNGGAYLPPHYGILAVYGGVLLINPRQGRNRFAGLLEGQVNNGVLTPTAQTSWLAVANALSASYNTETLWSPTLWSDTYQTVNAISSVSIRAQLPTQNSRKVGAGT